MLYCTYSATCIGLNVIPVTIETSISIGVGIYLIGLPDSAVKESLLRVTTSLQSYSYKIPGRKTVINMAPADIKKEGSGYDAAIAVGLLAASEQISITNIDKYMIMGELSLDGKLRPIKGSLPIAIESAKLGFKACIFPIESALEACEVESIEIYGAENIIQIIDILNGAEYTNNLKVSSSACSSDKIQNIDEDFSSILGQEFAKKGLEIAAAGNHNILMIGPPGAGKSFMAKCLSSILPPMSKDESLQTSAIYSVAGKLSEYGGLMKKRPFRSPHHTLSMVSLVGGGYNAMPGEISLAHNGVLYLDEMAQFSGASLDLLRQPLEDRKIAISRVRYKVEYPASFMLVGSSNPCPCGYYGEEGNRCTCSSGQVTKYMSKISGPLIDRIDITIRVKSVESSVLLSGKKGEPSSEIAKRVAAAREIQYNRLKNDNCFTNSQMNNEQMNRYCRLGGKELDFLNKIMIKYSLSARGYCRILKISRTIADLEGEKMVSLKHISEAVQYRFMEVL